MIGDFLLLERWYGQSLLFPLIFSWGAAALFRMIWGTKIGPKIACASAGAAFLVAYFVFVGLPAWPAAGSNNKIFYIGLLGLFIGIILDTELTNDRYKQIGIILLPLLALTWIIAPYITGKNLHDYYFLFGCIGIGTVVMFWKLSRTTINDNDKSIQLALFAAGLAIIAWHKGSFSQVELGMIFSASIFGFALWNWRKTRFPLGAALLLGIGMPISVLAIQLILYGSASKVALFILIIVFFSDLISKKIRIKNKQIKKFFQPIFSPIVGLTVIAIAGSISALM